MSLPVKTYFSTLLTGNQTQQVGANATCGLTQVMQGAPIMVLNPTNFRGAVLLGRRVADDRRRPAAQHRR